MKDPFNVPIFHSLLDEVAVPLGIVHSQQKPGDEIGSAGREFTVQLDDSNALVAYVYSSESRDED